MRSDRSETTGADRRDARTFCLDAAPCFRIVRTRDQRFLAGTHLQRERSLRRLGQQVLRWKSVTGFGGEAEAVEPAGGKHDRVETALTPFAETRVDVAAKRL